MSTRRESAGFSGKVTPKFAFGRALIPTQKAKFADAKYFETRSLDRSSSVNTKLSTPMSYSQSAASVTNYVSGSISNSTEKVTVHKERAENPPESPIISSIESNQAVHYVPISSNLTISPIFPHVSQEQDDIYRESSLEDPSSLSKNSTTIVENTIIDLQNMLKQTNLSRILCTKRLVSSQPVNDSLTGHIEPEQASNSLSNLHSYYPSYTEDPADNIHSDSESTILSTNIEATFSTIESTFDELRRNVQNRKDESAELHRDINNLKAQNKTLKNTPLRRSSKPVNKGGGRVSPQTLAYNKRRYPSPKLFGKPKHVDNVQATVHLSTHVPVIACDSPQSQSDGEKSESRDSDIDRLDFLRRENAELRDQNEKLKVDLKTAREEFESERIKCTNLENLLNTKSAGSSLIEHLTPSLAPIDLMESLTADQTTHIELAQLKARISMIEIERDRLCKDLENRYI